MKPAVLHEMSVILPTKDKGCWAGTFNKGYIASGAIRIHLIFTMPSRNYLMVYALIIDAYYFI